MFMSRFRCAASHRSCIRVAAQRTLATLPTIILAASLAAALSAPSRGQTSPPPQQGADGPATEGIGLLRNEPGTFPGYTLLSPLQSKTTYLIDMEGRVVRSWQADHAPASLAYLLDNGNLVRAGEHPDPPWSVGPAIGGRVQQFDWDGELIWDFTYYTENSVPHHDYAWLPNGNVILITIERKTAEEAIAAGRLPATVENGDMSLDGLVEIKPTGKTTGEVVWEWHMWDHLVQDLDREKANYGDVAAHPELIDINFRTGYTGPPASAEAAETQRRRDRGGRGGRGGGRSNSNDWTHTNAVAYNAELDQLMLSVHNSSEIWIIDHSTTSAEAAGHTGGRSGKGGDLLYRWGNPIAYRAGTADDQRLFVQHDAHWIPQGHPGEGHLLVFNNGRRGPEGSYSSVDEIVLPVDAGGHYTIGTGGKYGPDEAAWSYTAANPPDFYSSFISGASRLPNGNTLICSGRNGILFEVTQEKNIVWQYMNPPHGERGRGGGGGPNPRSLFRVYRYSPDFPGLIGKDLTPGRPLVELARDAASQQRER